MRLAASILIGLCSALVACEDPDLPCSACDAPGGGGAGAGGSGGAGGGSALVCPASGVYHGPWALRFDETSAVVRWDACKPGDVAITLTPEAGGAAQTVTGTQAPAVLTTSHQLLDIPPDVPGTYYTSEVALTGLEPGACYTYSLVAEPSAGGRFCTAEPDGGPISFMAIGDTNPGIAPTEDVLANVLVRSPDFTLHLGDIQYYSSVVDSWSQWFLSMQPMLSSGGAFMPSIGNHESENETEYTDYYDRLFADAGFDGNRRYYRFQSGGFWFFALDTESSLAPNSEQGIWLAQMLEDAQAQPGFRGSVVYMHRALITVGDAQSDPGLRSVLEPLFVEHDVRLVLAGHMHGYERFVSNGLTYVTSGGGGGALGNIDENVDERPDEAALRVASAAAFHAVHVEIGATSIDGAAIDETGAEIDSFSIALP